MAEQSDPVADILKGIKTTDAVRASAWDAFHEATNEDDLAKRLKQLPLAPNVKADLWDLKSKQAAPAVETSEPAKTSTPDRTWGDTATDVAIGAAKGLGNTVLGATETINKYVPGVRWASDKVQQAVYGDVVPTDPMFAQARKDLTPTNAPQQVGYTGEQIGEFFVPVSKAGKAVNVAKDAALALAQSGSPAQAGATAALGAVIPGGSATTKLASRLEGSAERSMTQALGATKEWAKVEAAKLAPEMLKRGIGGSRPAMLDLAKTTAARVGSELEQAYTTAAAAGEAVPGNIIRGHIQVAVDSLKVPTQFGHDVAIPGTERVVRQLDKLDQFVGKLGPDIPVDRAAKIKRTWDHIVSKAGLFGPKATASATDSADAWAIREASNSFRDLLNTNPTIEALNKESSFWIGLRNVLKETEKRTQAQSGGLIAAGMGGSGAVVGALSGDSASDRATKAVIGGLAGRQFVKLVQSPAFRTQVSGPLKNELAIALAKGDQGLISSTVGRIMASIPAQVRMAQ